MCSAINVIPEEEVLCSRRVTITLKNTNEVVKIPMKVTDDNDRSADGDKTRKMAK
jgi:hypothetical protein